MINNIRKSALIAVIVALSAITARAFSFSVKPLSGQKGTIVVLPVLLTNESEVSAFECQMTLPKGLSVPIIDDDKYDIVLSNRADKSHLLVSNYLSNGKIKIGAYSSSNSVFTGNTGQLFYVSLKLEGDCDEYIVNFSDIAVTSPTGKETVCPGFDVKVSISSSDVVISNAVSVPSENAVFSIELENQEEITAFECELIVPDGIMMAQDNGGFFTLSTGLRASSHVIVSNMLENGNIKVGLYSGINKTFDGAAGEIFSGAMMLTAEPGIYKVRVTNIYVTTNAGKEMHLEDKEFYVSYTNSYFSMEDVELIEGRSADFAVNIQNDEPFTSFSCTLDLPEGLNIIQTGDEYDVELTERTDETHVLSINRLSDGTIKALVYSTNNVPFIGQEGTVLSGKMIAAGMSGDYNIKLKDCYFISSDGKKTICSDTIGKINVISIATGLSNITDESDNKQYDLSGKAVGENAKGIVVTKGRKVVVK